MSAGGGTPTLEKIGCIEVMDNVFIGANSLIMNDVRIGPNAIIGAGSIVTKDVPPNSVVAGVPARVIGTFDAFVSKRQKEELYPEDLKPMGMKTNDALVDYCWKRFEQRHCDSVK